MYFSAVFLLQENKHIWAKILLNILDETERIISILSKVEPSAFSFFWCQMIWLTWKVEFELFILLMWIISSFQTGFG
jgi:hypothetical protein